MQRYIYSIAVDGTSFCYVDTREYDLQQKIDLEMKMREGTAKLLAACKHSQHTLEAAKSLLTSDRRLSEFQNEVQKRKSVHRNKSKVDQIPKAKASVSDIRIPLIWKDTDVFKNKGDDRRFAVFCLLKIGTEIYDTVMVEVDRTCPDVCFKDTFHFSNVSSDFQFELSIYARVLHDDLSMASTQKKLTYKISNSLSRSLGRKMINYKDDFDPETGPKFYQIAGATLNLKDSADLIKTYDLEINENLDKNLQLPLFGHFCCRLAVQPDCIMKDYICGILKFKNFDQEMFWCVLSKFKLNLWFMKSELQNEPAFLKHTSSKRPADRIIQINSHSKIIQQNSLITITNQKETYSFECINEQQQKDWLKYLLKMKDDFIVWEPIAEYNMELAPTPHQQNSFLQQPKSQYEYNDFHNSQQYRAANSLYNDISIHDTDQEMNGKKRHSKSPSFSMATKGAATYTLNKSMKSAF